MSRIELKGIDKYYGSNHVLKNLDLTIEDGEFMTLLGPSGCGKTTTLRVISGLERPQSGTIHMDGKEIVNAKELFFESPSKRGLNLVFQSYALWPHMTVFNNVAFGLTIKKVPKDEIKRRVENALERLQIGEFSKRYPSELSGGQQQRVAIARAIVSEPKLLLLDEPLSNLDAKLRIDMRSELKRLHQELGTTVVYVTHDQIEALTMSTRVAIFFDGVLAQVDTPINVYSNPADLRIADFIGNPRINLVDAKGIVMDGKLRVSSDLGVFEYERQDFACEAMPSGEFECRLGLRPEQIFIRRGNGGGFAGAIYACQPAGSETLLQVQVKNTRLLAKEIGLVHFSDDEQVSVHIRPNMINVYSKETGKLLKYAREDGEEQ
ncbi:MAG: ABC transporter ATP-binding protein [Bacillota bacterium]